MEFFYPGTPYEEFSVSANGSVFQNYAGGGTTNIAGTVTNTSSGSTLAASFSGTVMAGLQINRTLSFNSAGSVVTFTVQLTNTSGSTISNVAFMEAGDPDSGQPSTYSTDNDVVFPNAFVRGNAPAGASNPGYTVGLGTSDARAVVSVESGWPIVDPFNVINSPVDPDGATADSAIGLAFNFGNLAPGASVSATYYMVFASTPSGADARYAALFPSDFQITSLAANNAVAIEHNSVNGDDRGGIAVSTSQVFQTNDGGTGRFALTDLSGGTNIGTLYDAITGELRTQTVYSLGSNATTPIASGGGTVTHLLEINGSSGALTGNAIALSSPVVMGSGSGIFAGLDRVVLQSTSSGRVYSIAVPSGIVTDLGALATPSHSGTESWAYWGVTEHFGGDDYITYVQNSSTIARTRVSDGVTSTVATFSNLSDMASFTVSLSNSRWYFHHEGTSQFRSGDETIGFADAGFQGDFPFGETVDVAPDPRVTPVPYVDITFSEAINEATFNFNDLTLRRNGGANLIDNSVVISLVSGTTYRISDLTGFTTPAGTYTLTVNWSGIQTVGGAPFVSGDATETWTRTALSADVIDITPDPRTTPVSSVDVTFNMAITPATFDFNDVTLTRDGGANLIDSSVTISFVSGNTYRIDGLAPFSGADGLYVLSVNAAGIQDSSGVFGLATGSDSWAVNTLPADAFRILTLTTNNAVAIEHGTVNGDDRGGIAVSTSQVFQTNDGGTGRFALSDLSGGTNIGTLYNAITGDLRTQTVYTLGSNPTTPIGSGGGTVTHLLEINGSTGALTGNAIALAIPITVGSGTGIFAGYSRVVLHPNDGAVYEIDLRPGQVGRVGVLVGSLATPSHTTTESWAYWGVAEHFGGADYITYVRDSSTIARTRVSDGVTSTVASFSNLSDMASFTVSLSNNRWYFHHEGTSQFRSGDETIGFADMTYDLPPTVVSTTPALTGGIVAEGTTSMLVRFSESVVGADTASNYELRSVGADGLLGSADDVFVTLTPSYAGTTATLTFAALREGVYRLTVRDAIADATGNRLDGDGDGGAGGNWVRDFVVVTSNPPTFSSSPVTFSSGQVSYYPAAGDLNNDGRDDLVLVDYNASILINNGSGFNAPVVFNFGSGLEANRVFLADLNGDGWQDIFVNFRNNGVGIMLNNGAGQFTTLSRFAGAPSSYGIASGDFNGDNRPDLVSIGFGNSAGILLNNGVGGFGAYSQVVPVSAEGVTVGDFNGDGRADIALAETSNAVGILLGNGMAGFGPLTNFSAGITAPYNLAVGDFNGDGRQDLAVPNLGSNTMAIMIGNGAGSFSAASNFSTGGSSPYIALVRDVNFDGKQDVVTLNRGSNTIATLLGDGAGGLGAPNLISIAGSTINQALGDFNGDGFWDIATTDWSSSVARVLYGNSLSTVSLISPNAMTFDLDLVNFGAGQLLQGTNNAFDGLNRLQVSGVDFMPTTAAMLGDTSRTVVTGVQTLSGLDVHREITVVKTGSQDFARTIEVFSNPTGSPITTTVHIVGNLGSDAATTVFATSDGDTTVETTDQWIGTDDANGSGTPAIIHYIHGPLGLKPTSVVVTSDNIEWTFDITVAAGETLRLATLTILDTTRSGAMVDADTLVTLTAFGGQAAAFLTPSELDSIENFHFAHPPVADAGGPYPLDEGQDLDLDASASYDPDAGDSIVRYDWDLDNDGQYDDASTTSPTLTVTWAALQGLGIDDGPSSYMIGLQVTDSLGLTNTSSTALDLSNKAPTATLGNGSAVDEGSTGTVTFSAQFDSSTADTTAGFRYAYDFNNDGDFSDTDEIGDGTYANSSTSASVTVPAAYLDNNPSRTIHGRIIDKDDSYTDYYTTITVNNVAPTLAGANDFTTIDEDATGNSGDFVATLIAGQITDPGVNDPRGIAVVGLNNGNGWWEYDIGGGWTLLAAASDSSALLLRDTDKLRFVPDGMNGTAASITFRAWDQDTGMVGNTVDLSGAGATGGATAFSSATATATIIVTDVNDAPTLAGSMTLTTINTVDGNNQGNTVAEILASNGGNHVADVDLGAVQGIAIIAANNTLGTWQYTIDGGATWDVVGTPTASTALLLAVDTDTRLRFVSNGLSGGTARITVRAWDQTSGVNGGTADTTSNGGTTAFSTATAFTSVRINTPPQLNGVPLAATINENQAFAFTAWGSDSDVPSQSLTYSLSGAPSGATMGSSSGVFAWTPAENQGPATYVFDVCVSDGVTTVSRTVSLTVNEVNSAPALSGVPVSATINEGGTLTFTASASDSDDPAQTLTFSLVNAPLGASIHSSTGAFTWTASESQGGQTFTFAIRLGDGVTSVDQSISVTVNETNTAPTLMGVPNSVTIDEGALYTFAAGAADSDVPTQTLTFSLVGAPAGASINPTTGVFTWTPSESQGGQPFNFTVRVSDGVTNTDQAIDITVTETNTAPVLSGVPAVAIINEFQAYTFTAGASYSDLPAQALTFSLVGGPAGASIGSSSGVFTWTPSESQGGSTFNFSVRVSDGVTNTDQAIVITVAETNTAPVLSGVPAAVTINEFQAYTFTAGASDSDLPAQTLTFSLVAAPSGASINPTTGVFTWTPSEAQGGSTFNLTVRVSDGVTSTDQQISVTVTETNAAPILLGVPVAATIDEHQAYTFTVGATDSDQPVQFLMFSLVGAPAGASINPITGAFTWTPSESQGGSTFSFTVRVSDGVTNTDQAIDITVNETNTAPVLSGVPAAAIINELQAYTFTAGASDSDLPAQTLTFSLVGGPAGASIGSSSGVFTWTPSESQGGSTFNFTVRVSDGVANTDQAIVITVAETNTAPVLSGVPAAVTINELQAYTFTASATDSDLPAQTLSFALVAAPSGASINPTTGVFTWTPNELQGGQTFNFTVRVSDGVTSTDQLISVTVTETNTAPILSGVPVAVTIDEHQAYTFTAGATDSDQPVQFLTFSLVGAPAGASINPTTGVFTWTPSETQGGSTYSFTVRVSDGVTNTDQAIDITVNETNTAPVLSGVPLAVTVAEGQLLTFTAGATDSDAPAQSLSFSIVGGPAGASIGSSSGIFTWTPSVTQGAQTYNFTIRVNDTVTNTDQAITVSVIDTPPVAAGDVVSLAEGSPATTFNVLANDLGLGLSIISVTQGLNGAVAITGGGNTLTYQPTGDFNGVDTFTYTVQDGAGTQSTAVVIVAVTPVNDAPVLVATATATTLANQLTSLAGITVNDIDAGTGQMQVILSAANGTFTLGSVAGLTFSVGDGVDDSAMTFTGTLASINSALAGLGYRQARDICTTDTVDITINDLGNTGSGGNLSASASIVITPNYNTVQLLPDPFKSNTKALVINGTTGDDIIIVRPKLNSNGTPTTTLLVTVNGGLVQTISGVTGRILVYGHDGNDKIVVSAGIKKVTWLSGDAGNDTIIGGAGNDWISGGTGDDWLKGGVGFDRLVETSDVNFTLAGGTLTVDGSLAGLGNDVLYRNSIESARLTGGAGDNVFSITGFAGAATIDGGAGDDTLLGRNAVSIWTITSNNAGTVGKVRFSGVENLTGGTANDVFKFSNGTSVAGEVNGGGGINSLSYAAYLAAVKVNLLLGTATGVGGGISNIRNAVGGAGNDILVGDAANNVLSGRGGRNLLIGGAGKDTVSGGAADDILIGGTTDHDDDPINLDAIMALWADTNSYPSRIASLATLLSGATVQNDSGAIDKLTGGLGLDWFITSVGDVVADKNTGGAETKTVV